MRYTFCAKVDVPVARVSLKPEHEARIIPKKKNKNKNTTLEAFNFGLSVCQDVPQGGAS